MIFRIKEALAAAGDSTPKVVPLPRSSTFNTLTELLDSILQIMLLFGGVVVVILIGYSAILFMTAGASPDRRDRAKEVLKWTIIGYSIIVAFRLIISALAGFFGTDIEL